MGALGPLASELSVAKRLARQAGAAIEAVRLRGFTATEKADKSPVTEADLAADQVITEGLALAFPQDGILSEEAGISQDGGNDRFWVVDPLDGTKSFLHGDAPGYAVQIGLLVGDQAVLGVVFDPAEDRLYWAVDGQGAWLCEGSAEAQRITVSDVARPQDMVLVTSTTIGDDLRGRLIGLGFRDCRAMHSVGIKVGALTTGGGDVYISHHPVKYWDSCAPAVILREAGGRLTHLDGSPMSYALASHSAPRHPGGPFIATNGVCHDALLQGVGDVWHGAA